MTIKLCQIVTINVRNRRISRTLTLLNTQTRHHALSTTRGFRTVVHAPATQVL